MKKYKLLKDLPEKSIYNLEVEDKYYYIHEHGYVDYDLYEWENDFEFQCRLEVWNVFLTKEDAEKELEKRKALARIKKRIWENKIKKINKNKDYYIIEYDIHFQKFVIRYKKPLSPFTITFLHREDAKKCLEECKQDWEILFDLK